MKSKRRNRFLQLSVIGGMMGMAFFLQACAPINPEEHVICPETFVLKSGEYQNAHGRMSITHVSGTCNMDTTRLLTIHATVTLKEDQQPGPADLVVTLMKNKTTPVARRIIHLNGKGIETKSITITQKFKKLSDYPYSYGLFFLVDAPSVK